MLSRCRINGINWAITVDSSTTNLSFCKKSPKDIFNTVLDSSIYGKTVCGEQNFASHRRPKLSLSLRQTGAYLPRAIQQTSIYLFDDHSCGNPFALICSRKILLSLSGKAAQDSVGVQRRARQVDVGAPIDLRFC